MVRSWMFASIITAFCFASASLALEYVSPQQTAQLQADFGRADQPKEKLMARIAEQDLKCDMYGVRSHLQVERGVNLYRFQHSDAAWKNLGAQVVQSYRWVKNEFIGQQGEITDKIRVFRGQLISQLSIQGSSRTPNTILAYSVCKISI